jgi:hypothetical protein
MFARALTEVLRKSGVNPAAQPSARETLLRFHAEFRQLHAEILEEHVGAEALEEVLSALEEGGCLDQYIAARDAMARELGAGLQKLTATMGAIEL